MTALLGDDDVLNEYKENAVKLASEYDWDENFAKAFNFILNDLKKWKYSMSS